MPLPTKTEHIGAAGPITSIRELVDSPVPFIPPAVAPLAVGAPAASAPLSTLRPVEDDARSNAAVLRLDAAADWSRHQQERAELLADLRTASAGLHVHHRADAG